MIKAITTAVVILSTTSAHAGGFIGALGAASGASADASASAISGALSHSGAASLSSQTSSPSVSNRTGGSNSYGGAIGQAPTAATGACSGGVRLLFGALEFTQTLPRQCAASLAISAMHSGNEAQQLLATQIMQRMIEDAWPESSGDEGFRR